MPDTGSPWTIPYPLPSDRPDDPTQSRAWADRVATHLTTHNNSLATASSNVSTLQGQMSSLNSAISRRQIWTSTQQITWTGSPTSTALTVTYPSGIFTTAPNVFTQPADVWYFYTKTHSANQTSMTISGYYPGTPNAIQQVHATVIGTPLSMGRATAFAIDPDPEYGPLLSIPVTCGNSECPENGITSDVLTYEDADMICGACQGPLRTVAQPRRS